MWCQILLFDTHTHRVYGPWSIGFHVYKKIQGFQCVYSNTRVTAVECHMQIATVGTASPTLLPIQLELLFFWAGFPLFMMLWSSILGKSVGCVHVHIYYPSYVFLALWSCCITMSCVLNCSLSVSIFTLNGWIILKNGHLLLEELVLHESKQLQVCKSAGRLRQSTESSYHDSVLLTLVTRHQVTYHVKHIERH